MAKDSCAECGQPHPRCNGHAKRLRPKRPCMKWPKKGRPCCDMHGGNAGQVSGAADRRDAEDTARKELSRLLGDAQPVTNPLLEFQHLAGRVKKWTELLESKVADLDTWTSFSDGGGEQMRSEIALFERALAEFRQVLTAYARANIDERLAKVDETIAAAVIGVIIGTLRELHLGKDIEAKARLIAERRLEALEA